MSDRIEVHVKAYRGVPQALLAAIGTAIAKERPAAIITACDNDECGCNFMFVGGGE